MLPQICFDPATIRGRLPDNPFAAGLQVVECASSTQDRVWHAFDHGAPLGHGIIALDQTGGRGRLGRQWLSQPGMSLCYSCLVRPAWPASQGARLTLAAGLAMREALVSSSGIPTTIKWPNDLLHDGKKIAGILTESRASSGRIHAAVLGFGCNIHQQPSDFPTELAATATSITAAGFPPPDGDELFCSLAAALKARLEQPWEGIREDWMAACASTGKPVTLNLPDGTVRGNFLGIDNDGALMIMREDGRHEAYHSAEIL